MFKHFYYDDFGHYSEDRAMKMVHDRFSSTTIMLKN